MALINKLEAIGDAIREKTGTSDLLTLDQMATAISGITGGGEGSIDIPEEAFVISGECQYMFYGDRFRWYIEQFGDRITTQNIINAGYMFYSSQIKELPFEINFKEDGCACGYMLGATRELKFVPSIDFRHNTKYYTIDNMFVLSGVQEIGTLKNIYPEKMNAMFKSCNYLRYVPEFENLNMNRIYTYNYVGLNGMFQDCYSLRSIPEDLLKRLYAPLANNSSQLCYYGFNNCHSLDEIRGLNPQTNIAVTGNMFNSTFIGCSRLKDVIFETQEDGTSYAYNWKNQSITLINSSTNKSIGVAHSERHILDYNSGITADKKVTDDASYQALKNDPDWWTQLNEYSRYNHDSAVNTINSLPDTSAYLATAGGTNTIKFKGDAGSLTDGGAINTLTEEEIAVAAAKGWTVTFA